MIAALLGRIGAKVALIAGAVAAVAAALWAMLARAKQSGRMEVVTKQREKDLDSVKTRKQVERDVRRDTPAELDERLRDDYRD